MRLSRQQLADNEAKIRTAMTRLLNGDLPPGGKCDIKTLAGEAGVDRTAFYGSRPYAHLRTEFEQRLKELRDAGERPDPRDAQVARLKDEITRLKERLAQSDATISELAGFRGPGPGPARRPARRDHPAAPGSPAGRPHPPAASPGPSPRSRTRHDQHPAPESGLADAVRAGAAGLYSLEAACELVISTGWLHRDDFTRFVSTGTSLTDGVTELAHIDWQSVITSRDAGLLPCGSGENRILRLAASIAAGIPVDLNDALSGLDQASISLVVRAVRHANGQRPADFAGS